MMNDGLKCPICGYYTFEEEDNYDICPFCHWENDGLQYDDPDYAGGANDYSINEYRKLWEAWTAGGDPRKDNFERLKNYAESVLEECGGILAKTTTRFPDDRHIEYKEEYNPDCNIYRIQGKYYYIDRYWHEKPFLLVKSSDCLDGHYTSRNVYGIIDYDCSDEEIREEIMKNINYRLND